MQSVGYEHLFILQSTLSEKMDFSVRKNPREKIIIIHVVISDLGSSPTEADKCLGASARQSDRPCVQAP